MEQDDEDDEPNKHTNQSFGAIVRSLIRLLLLTATHMRSTFKELASNQFLGMILFHGKESLLTHDLPFTLFKVFFSFITETWLTLEALRFFYCENTHITFNYRVISSPGISTLSDCLTNRSTHRR